MIDEKMQQLLTSVSEKILESKKEVSIANGIDDLDAFNRIIIRNPGHIIYYNNLYIKVREVRLNEEQSLDETYAKLYCEYKSAINGEKSPSDTTVVQMIINNSKYQFQKRIVIRLESLEDSLKGILSAFRSQLDALQTVCNNLRAERKVI